MTHPSFPPPPGQPEPVASSTEGLSRQLDMVVARAMVTGLCRHLDALAGVAPGSPWIIWPDGMVCGLSGDNAAQVRAHVDGVAAGRTVADEATAWLEGQS